MNARILFAAATVLASTQIHAQTGDAYRISGPQSYENLTIFPIHGHGHAGRKLITLQEALAEHKVVVYETQSVNELAIANVSDDDVFISSGDIVKGGQQDRTMKDDFILPSKSGKVLVSAFCVEHGRWTRRGDEPINVFNGSNDMVATKALKMAVREQANQSEVWNQVAQAQAKLSSATGAPARATVSPSSMQMTLETPAVLRSTETYISALSKAAADPDVVGYAFAINGRMNSAEVYATHDLFIRLWPKLLKSAAVEAVSEYRLGATHFTTATRQDAESLLKDGPGEGISRQLNARTKVESKDTPSSTIFQTRDQASGTWVHMSYIAK